MISKQSCRLNLDRYRASALRASDVPFEREGVAKTVRLAPLGALRTRTPGKRA